MPLIEVRNLDFSYGDRTILNGVSFSVDQGDRWAVIGKNGAGKSTLVKCLCRLLPVDRGAVLLDGRDLHDYAPRSLARLVSYVPQQTGRQLPSYTAHEFVMMGRFPYQGFMASPSGQDRQVVQRSLELTDSTELADRRLTSLSGGELQCVLLAGAVSQQTPIVLLDEPVTFLDPLHQEMVRASLSRVHDEFGTTFVTVTHDVSAALLDSSHILALDAGKVRFAGPTAEFSSNGTDSLQGIFSIPFEPAVCSRSGRTLFVPERAP